MENKRIGLRNKNVNVESFDVFFRLHATRRMFQRKISEKDVFNVLFNGSVIEEYNDDKPFPSVLINGNNETGIYLHIVAGVDYKRENIYIITVYKPDINNWKNNYSKRI